MYNDLFLNDVIIEDRKIDGLDVRIIISVKNEDDEADTDALPSLSELRHKVLLTVEETNKLFGLGINCLRNAMRNPACPFTVFVSEKHQLIVRKRLEEYLLEHKYF